MRRPLPKADSASRRAEANAGANPGHPDPIDAAILNSAMSNTGAIVNSVAQAGGSALQTLAAAAVLDTDRDGMPDWFENQYGFNATVFDANGDNDHDGYTNLEEYINGLYTGFDMGGGVTPAAPAQIQVAVQPPIGLTGFSLDNLFQNWSGLQF